LSDSAPRVRDAALLVVVVLALAGAASATASAQPAPAAAPAAAPVAGEPRAVVERLHAGLLDVMKRAKTLGYEGRRRELEPLVGETYDLAFMARTAAGKHWRTLDEAQQAALVDAFSRMTVASYAGRFTDWKGERFETRAEDDGGQGTKLVRTALVASDGVTTQLDYRLRPADGGWRVIDVFLNGTVSELALRRSEYGAVMDREGFDALVASLETKIAALEKGEVAD
jgi:phospholipid transport system substrate-binding protein